MGGDPRLVFFDQDGNEAEMVDITEMDSNKISSELINRGFKEIEEKEDLSGEYRDDDEGEL